MTEYSIRPYDPESASDLEALRSMSKEVVDAGAMFVYEDVNEVLGYWLDPTGRCYLAVDREGSIAGTYAVKPNYPGRGAHVANAGYMVRTANRGAGLGALLCEHSIATARELGYRAMQYNFVVASNRSAVTLWERLGFRILGTLPKAFRHEDLGLVDAHVMFRDL